MNKLSHSRRLIPLAANFIFYLAFVLVDGPILCVDSTSYITMDYSREPVYPLFLALLRQVFGTETSIYGTENYLVAAVILQGILMAVCVWYTARSVGEILEPVMGRMQGCLLANVVLWGVDLLNRFAAGRGSMYVECIMTESLCIPLYYVFLIKAYQYYREHRRADLAWLFVLMLVLTSTRKQEMITMVILCGFGFLYDLILRRNLRAFVTAVATAAAAFLLMTALDYGYNVALRGVWMHKTDNYKGTACTFLYVATADDAALFTDETDRAIYEDIYGQMADQGLTYDSAPADADWITRSDHYADAYDIIGYDVLLPTVQRYIQEQNPDIEYLDLMVAADGEMQTIQNTLMGHNLGRLLSLWGASWLNGFVNTVLRKSTLLAAVSAALYALYGIGLALLARQNRCERKASADDGTALATTGQLLLFTCLVMVAIIVNVLVVGSMIFAQTRYMIYNMGFFYIALAGLAAAALRGVRGKETT